MSETLIHIEIEGTDKTIAQYVSNIIPRIGESLWVEKPEEEWKKDPQHEKTWDVKVVDVIYNVRRSNDIQRISNVYVIVEED